MGAAAARLRATQSSEEGCPSESENGRGAEADDRRAELQGFQVLLILQRRWLLLRLVDEKKRGVDWKWNASYVDWGHGVAALSVDEELVKMLGDLESSDGRCRNTSTPTPAVSSCSPVANACERTLYTYPRSSTKWASPRSTKSESVQHGRRCHPFPCDVFVGPPLRREILRVLRLTETHPLDPASRSTTSKSSEPSLKGAESPDRWNSKENPTVDWTFESQLSRWT